MMQDVYPVIKPVGKTPLQILEQLRKVYPELHNQKLSYAGRLDPMADGLLLILVGEENKKRHIYEALPKKYIFKTILGIATDSYDLLGLVTTMRTITQSESTLFQESLRRLPSTFTQAYPPFSSRTVKGKPLYYWAREHLLHTIVIPKKEVRIFATSIRDVDQITSHEILAYMKKTIPVIQGAFRQEEIIADWSIFANETASFPVITSELSCSSGTYIRGIAHTLGEQLSIPAVAFQIKRIAIGEFTITDALVLSD